LKEIIEIFLTSTSGLKKSLEIIVINIKRKKYNLCEQK
jgi:hypothetical protein